MLDRELLGQLVSDPVSGISCTALRTESVVAAMPCEVMFLAMCTVEASPSHCTCSALVDALQSLVHLDTQGIAVLFQARIGMPEKYIGY